MNDIESENLEENKKISANTITERYITASLLMEYLYCPRFIFFIDCLCIPEREEKRKKVLIGRELHKERAKTNIDYLRKRIGCVEKEINVYLSSKDLKIHGEVDEVLTLSDGTMAPLDYKFSEYREFTFRTHRYQSIFYGLLIKENYKKEVKRGFICYTRSKNLLKEIQIKKENFEVLKNYIKEIIKIRFYSFFPKSAKNKMKCIDCAYRNICIKI